MVAAHDLYGGVSEQVYCNAHSAEQQAIAYFGNILVFTPYDYEFVGAWNLWWTFTTGKPVIRRETFEFTYGFTFGQRFNPLTQQLEDVIIISNTDYFTYIGLGLAQGTIDCPSLLYPSWP